MLDNLRADIDRWRKDDIAEGWFQRNRCIQTIRCLMNMGMAPVVIYRLEHWVYKQVRIPVLRQMLQLAGVLLRRFTAIWTGVFISPKAEIGPGLEIHTFYGIFIGITSIGKNCTVGTGVLISCGVRSIGDNVYIGAGAKVVGDVKVGNNVVIMANSLVITDVRDNTTIAGVPARIKLRGGRPTQFYPAIGNKAPAKRQVATVPRVSVLQPANHDSMTLTDSDVQTAVPPQKR